MALTRKKAEKSYGLAFSVEGESYPSDPDQEHWSADLTLDGHTYTFEGKSAEDVVASAESVLKARGVIVTEPEVVQNEQGENQVHQADILSKDQLLPADAADENHPTIEEGAGN